MRPDRGRDGAESGRGRRRMILGAALIAAGILAFVVPRLLQRSRADADRQAKTVYVESTEGKTDDTYEGMLSEADAWNREHRKNTFLQQTGSGDLQNLSDPADTEEYRQLLDPMGDGVMGYLDVPALELTIPILHGTGEKALSQGCGHLAGTSLPVGGKGTHAVLAAHRGLAKKKLFRDLDRVQVGDTFTIRILTRTLHYRVDQIRTVEPDDVAELQIDPKRDQVTLLACTPYGVNSQRLLVRGQRVQKTK